MTTQEIPYRVVDANNQGWHQTVGDGGAVVYAADYGWQRDLASRSLDALRRDRGPLRPVLPITDEDEQLLGDTFRSLGRKTITTLAAAVEQVFHDVREHRGGLAAQDSFDYAVRTLLAGREGSWESEVLKNIIWFGNGLNLNQPKRGEDPSVEAMRKRGPSKRVDVDGRRILAEVIGRWVTDPDRYTEVAETLAAVVSQYADDTAGPNGWKAIADQWLQPNGLAREDFSNCYRLLYSQSEHFDSNLL